MVLFIFKWLRRLLMRRRPAKAAPLAPQPVAVATPAAALGPIVTEIPSNRHDRRAAERARRKYDKFVTPVGKLPAKPKPETQEIKPARRKRIEIITPAETVHDNELLIVDSHHENRNDLVAYKEAEVYGEFNFRDTILQQLERYFVYLDRMKKHDADAYGYYCQMGATILPYLATNAQNRGAEDPKKLRRNTPLADWFNKTRPSFGCFVYGADPETERYEKETAPKNGKENYEVWVPKFMYFKKYKKPPPEIQMISGGDIYSMTIWWDRPFDKKIKYGVPQEFGIFVSRDGEEVVALRCCDTKYVPIRHKTNGAGHKRGQTFTIPQRAWHIPGDFDKWAKENGDTAQHFLTELFKETICRNEMSQYSMTRVAATKDGMTAVFSVNIHRTAYFFQDRDVALGEDGKRKRIFHFVRPHTRSDGSTVKAHFRGEREFSWAGYGIKITIPGRDHLDFNDIDIGTTDEYWWDKKEKYLDMPALGKKLKGWMDEGKGKRA